MYAQTQDAAGTGTLLLKVSTSESCCEAAQPAASMIAHVGKLVFQHEWSAADHTGLPEMSNIDLMLRVQMPLTYPWARLSLLLSQEQRTWQGLLL